MKKFFILLLIFGIMTTFSGCLANQTTDADIADNNLKSKTTTVKQEAKIMKLYIDEIEVPVAWEENSSTADLKKYLPLKISMSKYGGFEQVGSIGRNIVSNDEKITTNYGDIVLYASNKIVIFYGSNSWSYTRLGHINLSQKEMNDLLSKNDVNITIVEE